MILFDFELEVDTQKVLTGEPWAFDRHLVVMERYDGSYPVHTLKFDSTLRWVGLSFKYERLPNIYNWYG